MAHFFKGAALLLSSQFALAQNVEMPEPKAKFASCMLGPDLADGIDENGLGGYLIFKQKGSDGPMKAFGIISKEATGKKEERYMDI